MSDTPAAVSQLFILRLWAEDVGDGRFEIRGQVKHVPSGESDYFREWADLLSFMTQRLLSGKAVDERVQGSG
jgi:hypothetical protein